MLLIPTLLALASVEDEGGILPSKAFEACEAFERSKRPMNLPRLHIQRTAQRQRLRGFSPRARRTAALKLIIC